MPNIKSAEKRMRTAEKARLRNHAAKTKAQTARRKLSEAIANADKARSEEAYRSYCSVLDVAVKKGAINANAANRRKSRVAAKLRAL